MKHVSQRLHYVNITIITRGGPITIRFDSVKEGLNFYKVISTVFKDGENHIVNFSTMQMDYTIKTGDVCAIYYSIRKEGYNYG